MYIEAHHPCRLGCKPPHIIRWELPCKASCAQSCVNNHKVQLVIACHVYNKIKSETILLNFLEHPLKFIVVDVMNMQSSMNKLNYMLFFIIIKHH